VAKYHVRRQKTRGTPVSIFGLSKGMISKQLFPFYPSLLAKV